MMFEKKLQVVFFLWSLCILCSSCRENYCRYSEYLQCNSGSQNPKLLWTKQVSDPEAGVSTYTYVGGFPYYDNIVAVGYAKDPRQVGFLGLNLNTGEQVWETPFSSELRTTAPFVMLGKNVILPRSSRWFQLMDVTTGTIVEDKTISGYYWEHIQKLGDRLVYPGAVRNSKGSYDECFFQSSVNAPFNISVLLPPNKRNDFIGGGEFNIYIKLRSYKIFIGKGTYEGDTLLLFKQSDPMFDGAVVGQDYYYSNNLYNISKKQWIYRHKEGPTPLCIDEESGKMFMTYFDSYNYRDRDDPKVRGKIYAYNLYTSEELWTTPYKETVNTIQKGVIVDDVLLVCKNADNTLALNKNTGKVIWEKDFSGMNEFDVQLLNGVLYFTTSYLVAVDIRTGDLLWNIRSSNADKSSQKFGSPYFFSSHLQAISGKNGEKGKIVAYDYLNAYCYEAIR